MIYGRLDDWQRDKDSFPEIFDKAFAFCAGKNLAELADGKYPIDGDALFALVQSPATEDAALRKFEIHKKYLDIQLLASGAEKQLYAPTTDGMDALEDKLADSDVAFYGAPRTYSSLVMRPGDYAVYFPGEAHAPCCAAAAQGETIKKIVFKIAWGN